MSKPYSLRQLCRRIGIEYEGEDRKISGLNTLADATESELSFLHNDKYASALAATKAAAVLVPPRYREEVPDSSVALVTDEPYLALARLSELFAYRPEPGAYEPEVGEGCRIDPSVRFGKGVQIGSGTTVMAGCYIGDGVRIGRECLIHPNVTLYHGCRIDDRVIVHSGAVIGSDGYGFAHTREGEHVKLHQLGAVHVESDVEIGANTTIDRGALGDTVIGQGTKIDNLVQIGHNCRIGPYNLIVAQVGLAGSTVTGRNVVLGGQSASAGHLHIGDFATFAARSGITKSLEGGQTYAGAPAIEIRLWRRLQAALMRLAKGKER